MNCYSENELKKIQSTELGILQYFDSFCREHNIQYYVLFGTEIGAIRHKGFIPWDDDVDVGMLREDYNKLLLLRNQFCSKPYNENEKSGQINEYFLVDPGDNVPFHEKVFPRIYKRNTIFSMEVGCGNYYIREDQHKPIGVDIFVFDRCDSLQDAISHMKAVTLFKNLYLYSRFKCKILANDTTRGKLKSLLKVGCYALGRLTRGAFTSIIYKMFLRACVKDSGEYVIQYATLEKSEIINSLCKRSELFPLSRVPFERIMVSLRNNYDSSLRSIYGDYMVLPPVEQRVSHPPIILDFGE